MTEKLIINHFAGIDNLEITLEEINIITGPQATGKSICAKTLYFFKSVFRNMANSFENKIDKREFDRAVLKKFEEYFPPQFLGREDYDLKYILDDNYIEIARVDRKIKLQYSENYRKQISFLRSEIKNSYIGGKNINGEIDRYGLNYEIREKYFTNLISSIGKKSAYIQLFIPAGRSFFALIQSNIFTFLSSSQAVDPFLIEFGALYETMKRYKNFGLYEVGGKKGKKHYQELNILAKEILHGEYEQDHEKDFLMLEDGRKVGLANSSSGQQELLPLTLILSMLPYGAITKYGSTIYIEEPEAHIFPDAQKKIVDLIAYVYNNSFTPMQFVITTHSPYVLSSINNLIYAGILGITEKPQNKRKINTLVSEKYWLHTDKVSAYSLHNGKCDCIKSKETGLIDTDYLDSISNEIGGIFDELIELS